MTQSHTTCYHMTKLSRIESGYWLCGRYEIIRTKLHKQGKQSFHLFYKGVKLGSYKTFKIAKIAIY